MKKKIFAGVALVVLIGVGGYIYWSGNAGKEESASSATFFTEELEQADTYDQPSKPVAVEAEVGRPVFDIVRVEPDGSMVAAGRGIPNDTLSLMDGENVLASVSVDDRGEWVYIPSDPLIVGTHELWLKNDEVRSREEAEIVVVTVPETKKQDDTIAVLMSSDAEDVKVLQGPEASETSYVNIMSANYNGKVFVVRGTVQGEGEVRLYLDNVYLGSAKTTENGEWSFKSYRTMENGRSYTLRADKADERGKVSARAEVPFSVAKGADTSKQRRVRIVKGDNLWTIAKHLYGSGFAYVTIYRANKDQIKDPNLIYPNQVFVLPKKAEK